MYYTGHFGYWELQVMMHAVRFQPIVMVARTLDNPFLERFIERIRTRVRTRVVPRQGAVRSLLRALLGRDSVGMMIDQHIQDRSAILINFFDRPASTTSAIAALALRTGVPIIPVFALPLPDGRYRMIYETPVERPTRTILMLCEPIRSGAPTCWRCTCDATQSCGSGCTGAGVRRRRSRQTTLRGTRDRSTSPSRETPAGRERRRERLRWVRSFRSSVGRIG